MPRRRIFPDTIEEVVEDILPYLEDTSNDAHMSIFFDGWGGLAASVVLRAIVKDPPSSLLRKFNKIIHIDCSRWKSRRDLQRIIAQELKLPQEIMDVLDMQDEDDDFRGVDEGSRVEIRHVGREIIKVFMQQKCLVVFHNGSNDMINLSEFGIPQLECFDTKVLWTFRGRLQLKKEIIEKVDNSHLCLYNTGCSSPISWYHLVRNVAREIVRDNTDEFTYAVENCLFYMLSLNSRGRHVIDYNWAIHASNYWVCDGIIEGGQADKAWEIADALHQQMHIGDYSSIEFPSFGYDPSIPTDHWILAKDNSYVPQESTSFFLAAVTNIFDPSLLQLPKDMFCQSNKQLRVLKLCRCTFSFSFPPFHGCCSLRFLGLDCCKDRPREEEEKQDRQKMDCFRTLWVLDICSTDWELDLSPEVIEKMATNIREVHIKKGKFWRINFSWRKLENLRKLRVIEPTCSWETGVKDEFIDMVKMEFLDLSGNCTIQVMPSLSGATVLKTLVLDGCGGLEHVGPEGLPPLLESFSFDACTIVDQNKDAKISHISLACCAKLVKFKICGSLTNLEMLDLSGTLVKTLDLRDHVVQAKSLKRIFLWGCLLLHAILWPEDGLPKLMILHIDSLACRLQTKLNQAYATIVDIRIIQTLVLQCKFRFCWNGTRFYINLCTNKVDGETEKDMIDPGCSVQLLVGPPQPKLLTPNNSNTYTDVPIDNMTIYQDTNNNVVQFYRSSHHVEIGEGISDFGVESLQVMKAIIFLMEEAESLYVHDNSSLTVVIREHMMYIEGTKLTWEHLKQCKVVRCPKIHTVFTTQYEDRCFPELENFWAADLLMAHCIWSKGRVLRWFWNYSCMKLQSIHLYSCPRLRFVLPLSGDTVGPYLPNLETLHIVDSGDLKEVFPVDPRMLARMFPNWDEKAFEFPKLKHIYLHQLYKLQHICEAKMFAPKLETVRLRGCWGLRRLPVVWRHSRQHPIVDCEKDWWDKLEWDGLPSHHPSLFEPHCSSYYKKPLPRASVLR